MSAAALNIAIRVDASAQMGTGHFMRCLTLAGELKSRGAHVRFVSRNPPMPLADMLSHRGIELSALRGDANGLPAHDLTYSHWLGVSQEQDAKDTIRALSDGSWAWLVVDHYALDDRWEAALRQVGARVLVIDDLANRRHDCDALLDQNYYRDMEGRYENLVPSRCRKFLGPRYVLLRPEFTEQRAHPRVRDGNVRRILVFFGGSDPTDETSKALRALQELHGQVAVDVVVGAINPHCDKIAGLCAALPASTLYRQVNNMAELMVKADLAIGAGGSAMWERCYLGLPTLTVVIADNQKQTTQDAAAAGSIEFLGHAQQLDSGDYARAIAAMIKNPLRVKQIGDNAMKLMAQAGASAADLMLGGRQIG